jgi:hypothetical protein
LGVLHDYPFLLSKEGANLLPYLSLTGGSVKIHPPLFSTGNEACFIRENGHLLGWVESDVA